MRPFCSPLVKLEVNAGTKEIGTLTQYKRQPQTNPFWQLINFTTTQPFQYTMIDVIIVIAINIDTYITRVDITLHVSLADIISSPLYLDLSQQGIE